MFNGVFLFSVRFFSSVTSSIWTVTAYMRAVTASMWAVTGAVRAVTDFYVGCYRHFMDC